MVRSLARASGATPSSTSPTNSADRYDSNDDDHDDDDDDGNESDDGLVDGVQEQAATTRNDDAAAAEPVRASDEVFEDLERGLSVERNR